MAEREIGSPDDLRRHFQQLAPRREEGDPVLRRWHVAKRITWMLLLAATFLLYYLVSKLLEALTLLK